MEIENSDLMEKVHGMAYRKGAYGHLNAHGVPDGLPQVLEGRKTEFEFETPVHQARRRRDTYAAQALIGSAITAAGVADVLPDLTAAYRDQVDWDKLARAEAEGNGVPLEWMKKEDRVEAMRAHQAEQAQQQALEETLARSVETAASARPENLAALDAAIAENGDA